MPCSHATFAWTDPVCLVATTLFPFLLSLSLVPHRPSQHKQHAVRDSASRRWRSPDGKLHIRGLQLGKSTPGTCFWHSLVPLFQLCASMRLTVRRCCTQPENATNNVGMAPASWRNSYYAPDAVTPWSMQYYDYGGSLDEPVVNPHEPINE